MPQDQTHRSTSHLVPVLVLIILAPTIAEILLGDLLLNATFVPTLIMYLLLYGSGTLLIREVARRLHLGWPSIIVLGVAYGVVEEGLILQTCFNPHFPGLAHAAAYGRALGVSWFWMISVLGMHAVWSITLPILVAELLFPSIAHRPWLGRVGLGLDAIVYLLTGLVMFRFFTAFSHFSAAPLALLGAALMVVVLVVLALFLLPRSVGVSAGSRARSVPAPWMVGLAAFVAGVLFFALQVAFPTMPAIPPLLPILLYAGLYARMGLLIWRWATVAGWNDQHSLALAAGALLTYMLYGFRLAARGSLADVVMHSALCGIIALLLVWVASRQTWASSRSQERLIMAAATHTTSAPARPNGLR
jgi:hypothetical protein